LYQSKLICLYKNGLLTTVLLLDNNKVYPSGTALEAIS
jgi:hypothetical protein